MRVGRIGGNISAVIEVKKTAGNEIGAEREQWTAYRTVPGFLDMIGEGTDRTTFNKKVQDSDYIFLTDYIELPGVDEENSRLRIANKIYEVRLYDDPMGMHEQLEIYLRYLGGQQDGL